MANDETAAGSPFDIGTIRELISLMDQHGLNEIDLRSGSQRWMMRRGPREVMQMYPPAYAPGAPAMLAPAPGGPLAPAAQAPAAASAEVPAAPGQVINSPTVGTFYSAPAPGDPPFVTVGSKVAPESVVCVIEAMKVFNQILAEVNGTITEILVKNGDPVEFGQPLFRVQLG